MPESIKPFIFWALDEFGIEIHEHQLHRVQLEIEKYIKDKNTTPTQLIIYLKQKKVPYFNDITDIITVQESYFFRDQALFLYLQNQYLPSLINTKRLKGDLNISIWSAGASLGEEIYSIAILLKELITDFDKWSCHLIATDINDFALSYARKGVFGNKALRSTSSYFKNKYFEPKDQYYHLSTSIKEMSRFIEHNLNSPTPPEKTFFDMIICRNALIYLTDKTIHNALHLFEQALIETGRLFLGPSDFVTYQTHNLLMLQENGIFYFNKKINDILKIPTNASPPEPIEMCSYAERVKSNTTSYEKIKQLIENKDYQEALRTVNHLVDLKKENVLIYRYKAQALIGLGDNLTALENLKKASEQDPSDPKTYYFIGLCHNEENQLTLAKNALNKALSLKPDFPEANHALALLLLNDKELEKGLERLNIAHHQARSIDGKTKVLSSNETMKEFADIIEKEIHYYKDFFNE